MSKENLILSPLFNEIKIPRSLLKDLEKVNNSIDKHILSYAYYYLRLVSRCAAKDVDTEDKTFMPEGRRPHFYIKNKKALLEQLGLKSGETKKMEKILTALRDDYHAIFYQKIGRRYYFHCNIGVHARNLSAEYNPNSKNDNTTAKAGMNFDGFIFINKRQFINTFYIQNEDPKGMVDVYLLLYINTIFNASLSPKCFPFALANTPIVSWSVDASKNDTVTKFSFYCLKKQLAELTNNSANDGKNIQRYLNKLEELKFIKKHKYGNYMIITLKLDGYSMIKGREPNNIADIISSYTSLAKELFGIESFNIQKYSLNFINTKSSHWEKNKNHQNLEYDICDAA